MSSERTSRHVFPSRYASSSGPPPFRRRSEPVSRASAGSRIVWMRRWPPLAAKSKRTSSRLTAHVAAPERREPVGPVLLRVRLRADAEEAEIQQSDGAGERSIAREAARGDVPFAHLPHRGKTPRQTEDPVELLAVTTSPPIIVIQVLLPPGVIRTHGLEVSTVVRTDPHLLPRGRDRQRTDPRERLVVANPLAVRVDVDESSPVSPPRDARPCASHPLERAHRPLPSSAGSSNLTSTRSSGRARSSSA